MTGKTPIVAALVLTTLAACAGPDEQLPADARVTIDTVDGVPHVISGNRGAWVRGGAWRVHADSGVHIGAVEGAEPYTFGRLSGVVVGDDGRIYVGDRQALEVRVFSADGRFIRRLGRDGEGPGEFRHIGGMVRAPDGIAVLDGREARVTVFSPDGALVRTFRIQRPYMILESFAVMRYDEDGRLYDRAQLGTAPLVDSIGVYIYSAAGEPLDTVEVMTLEPDHLVIERGGVRVMSFPRPFSARPSVAVGPDGRIYATRGDRYRILVLAPDGDTLRVVRRELEPRPVSAEERDSALARVERQYRVATGGGAPREINVPATKPMIGDLEVDRKGYLWVAAVPEPSWRGSEWGVHDPEGRYLGPVALPLHVVTDIGEDYVAGVEYDELGVPHVAVYPLVR